MGIVGQKSLLVVSDSPLATILSILAVNLTLLISSAYVSPTTLSLRFNSQNLYTLSDVLIYLYDYLEEKKHITLYLNVVQ